MMSDLEQIGEMVDTTYVKIEICILAGDHREAEALALDWLAFVRMYSTKLMEIIDQHE